MLLPVLVDREALKVDVPSRAELGLHRPRDVDGGLDAQLFHAVLHDAELDCDDARHLYGATEGNLAVSLAEMQVSDAELRSRH